MKIQRFTVGPLGVNCYLLWDETTLDGAIIDYGAGSDDEHDSIEHFVESQHIALRMSLLTHAHFDHVFGLKRLSRQYGLPPMCHPDDQNLYRQAPLMARALGLDLDDPLPPLGPFLHDGDELLLGTIRLRVIHTPGHSPGSVCLHLPEAGILFSGDTLFAGSIGRTDLPGGSYTAIEHSIRERLYTLPPKTYALPGHGPQTTIEWEREENGYVKA
ncbi:MAG: MBL fold metallo-hydrolase [Bacteroidaceae bacterium]|nr:MBL fold metallo-hydrolase [Bacteroidaceae bacterium]